MNFKDFIALVKETFSRWSEDNASRLAAALAYYTIFSLAPLLIIAIAVIGVIFGEGTARQQILDQIRGVMGPQGADAISTMLDNASRPGASLVATVIGVITLFLGASGVFGQLKGALNTVWGTKPRVETGIVATIKDKLLAVGMVLGIGLLLAATLVASTGLAALNRYFGDLLPGADILWQILNFAVTFGLITLLFGFIYKILPDAEIAWKDVWVGAAVTALLFVIGELLIGLYLAYGSPGSTYGAAGSLVALLVWVYYSAQVLFLGAEFTQVYARRYGSRILPSMVPEDEEERARPSVAQAAVEVSALSEGIPSRPSVTPRTDLIRASGKSYALLTGATAILALLFSELWFGYREKK